MFRLIVALPALLALGAPGLQSAPAAPPTRFAPGEWESSARITDLEMAGHRGMPPEMLAQLRRSLIGSIRSARSCIAPKQAGKPDSGVFTGKADGRCTYRTFTMANGRIDATLVCTDPRGARMTRTIAGTFTETSFALTSAIDMRGGTGRGMRVKARISGRRIGACKR